MDPGLETAGSGIKSIKTIGLLGKLKLWGLQFGLLPQLLWPRTVYDVPISKVEKLEGMLFLQKNMAGIIMA